MRSRGCFRHLFSYCRSEPRDDSPLIVPALGLLMTAGPTQLAAAALCAVGLLHSSSALATTSCDDVQRLVHPSWGRLSECLAAALARPAVVAAAAAQQTHGVAAAACFAAAYLRSRYPGGLPEAASQRLRPALPHVAAYAMAAAADLGKLGAVHTIAATCRYVDSLVILPASAPSTIQRVCGA